jgi:hypothetical protein
MFWLSVLYSFVFSLKFHYFTTALSTSSVISISLFCTKLTEVSQHSVLQICSYAVFYRLLLTTITYTDILTTGTIMGDFMGSTRFQKISGHSIAILVIVVDGSLMFGKPCLDLPFEREARIDHLTCLTMLLAYTSL